jgi:hypothetical protein
VTTAATADGARIEVRDTGVGIDPAELPRIFDRFYRGTGANEARGSGSGLGLAIVRSIVDMHGGSVSVESRPGAGSRFVVTLPRDPRTPPTGGDTAGTAEGSPARQAPGLAAGRDMHAPDGALPALAKMVDSSPPDPSRLNPGPSP